MAYDLEEEVMPTMTDNAAPRPADDAHDLAQVAALVARAGLRLPADQIAGLVSTYRADRQGLERLRRIVQSADEPAHIPPAGRAERQPA